MKNGKGKRQEKDTYQKMLDKVKKEANKVSLINEEVNNTMKEEPTVSKIFESRRKKRTRSSSSSIVKGKVDDIPFFYDRIGDGINDEDDDDDLPFPLNKKQRNDHQFTPIPILLQHLLREKDPNLCFANPSSVAKDYFNDDEQRSILMIEPKRKKSKGRGGGKGKEQREVVSYDKIVPLLNLWDHQKETLDFIERRENDIDKIGCNGLMMILEMGLGKTLTCLTRILLKNQMKYIENGGKRFNGPSLVLCKPLLIPTWKREIMKGFPENTFVFYDFSDPTQLDNIESIHIEEGCDIVFVTYSMLVSIYTTLNRHNSDKNYVGDGDEDDDEIASFFKDDDDDPYYSTLRRQKTIERHDKLKPLFSILWERVITDESQQFVNQKTKLFNAVYSLKSKSNWIVTGTPIQNSIENLYTCFDFIGLDRSLYTSSNGGGGNNEALTSRKIRNILSIVMTRREKNDILSKKNNIFTCKGVHSDIVYLNYQTTQEKLVYLFYALFGLQNLRRKRAGGNITKTSISSSSSSSSSLPLTTSTKHNHVTYIIQLMRQLCVSFKIVKNLILPKGMLTFNMGKELQLKKTGFNESLFGDEEEEVPIDDNEEEEEVVVMGEDDYDDEENDSKVIKGRKVSASKKRKTKKKNNGMDDLQEFARSMENNSSLTYQYLLGSDTKKESIIWEPYKLTKTLDDKGKSLYRFIYEEMLKEKSDYEIKTQLLSTSSSSYNSSLIDSIIVDLHKRRLSCLSTKDDYLIDYIKKISDPTDKIVIFSDYVTALSSISKRLKKEGINNAIVTGNQSQMMNNSELKRFQDSTSVNILLLSLKLGNSGLDLSCANRLFFLSDWWNPQVELQAHHRVLRPGQTKEVYIHYIIMDGTIEKHILKLSNNKKKIASIIEPEKENNDDDNDEKGSNVAMDTSSSSLIIETEKKRLNKQCKEELFNFDIDLVRIQ